MRLVHSFSAFLVKTTPCFREYWPWLGYSFILFIAIYLERNISFKLFNFFRTAVGFDWICAFWRSAGLARKSRGLKDTYYKDPDIKPETNLTSQQLMKFAWQIADGMSYLSSKFVSWKKKKKQTNKQTKNIKNLIIYHCEAYRLGRIILWYNVISLNDYAWEVRTYSYSLVEGLSYRDPIHFQPYHLLFSFF